MSKGATPLQELGKRCVICGQEIKPARWKGEHWEGGEPVYVIRSRVSGTVIAHEKCYKGELRNEAETS